MSRVGRYERLDARSLKPPMRMDNGFLKVEGHIARVGVQEYRRADGTTHRELRLPEEVFDADSLASFCQLPVTNRHPPGMLTAKNAKQYAVGNVGENVRRDGDYVAAPLMITDADAIAATEAGRSQLSNGYSCEMDDTQDPQLVALYGKYDSIQRKIRGNHVALVDVARAGPDARLRLDEGEAESVLQSNANDMIGSIQSTPQMEPMRMHKFKIDGLEIEVADANAQSIIERAMAKASEKSDAAVKSIADKDKAISELTAKLDASESARKDDAERLAAQPAIVAEEVKQIAVLMDEARRHIGNGAALEPNKTAIRKAVIAKLRPKAVLDGKDDAYVTAYYDSVVADAKDAPTSIDRARAGIVEASAKVDGAPSSNPEEARARMVARNLAAFVK